MEVTLHVIASYIHDLCKICWCSTVLVRTSDSLRWKGCLLPVCPDFFVKVLIGCVWPVETGPMDLRTRTKPWLSVISVSNTGFCNLNQSTKWSNWLKCHEVKVRDGGCGCLECIHPWKLRWKLKNHPIGKGNHLPNLHDFGVHVDFPGFSEGFVELPIVATW